VSPTPPTFEHEPVMRDEIVELFAAVPAGVVVDATVGGGGHSAALLTAHPHLAVVGLDQDPDAVAAARERLAPFGDRASVHHVRFDRIAATVEGLGIASLSGVLFDLGVSSPQLDRPERGFAHRHDAPLDMRMNPTTGPSAHDVVNTYSEAELVRVLRQHADERFAGRIARSIVSSRPVDSTAQLADLIRDAIPAPARRRGGHPAARSFQAIRIEVNQELDVLPVALDDAIALLAPGGRCVVLSYHSGEDRIVKERLRTASTGGCTCPPHLPCGCGAQPVVRLLKRGSRTPSAAEVLTNRRAASARLRAVEKLPPPPTPTATDDARGVA
jgi:16S rRNA (cytosine1402-N4)-methyltransferase